MTTTANGIKAKKVFKVLQCFTYLDALGVFTKAEYAKFTGKYLQKVGLTRDELWDIIDEGDMSDALDEFSEFFRS